MLPKEIYWMPGEFIIRKQTSKMAGQTNCKRLKCYHCKTKIQDSLVVILHSRKVSLINDLIQSRFEVHDSVHFDRYILNGSTCMIQRTSKTIGHDLAKLVTD